MDSVSSDSMVNDDDLMDGDDDKFGIESGGWRCFMSSFPIIYHQMWLFVSRKIPHLI
jgi:hypothetical protein